MILASYGPIDAVETKPCIATTQRVLVIQLCCRFRRVLQRLEMIRDYSLDTLTQRQFLAKRGLFAYRLVIDPSYRDACCKKPVCRLSTHYNDPSKIHVFFAWFLKSLEHSYRAVCSL